MKFQKLQTQLRKHQEELENLRVRLAETERTIESDRDKVAALSKTIQQTLANGVSPEKVPELTEKRKIEEGIENNTLLVTGLKEKIPQQGQKVDEARKELDACFAGLAEKWLEREINEYDAAARTVIQCIKRFFACRAQLAAIGKAEIWESSLGEITRYLNKTKVGTVRNFNKNRFIDTVVGFQFPQALSDELFKEITAQ